MSQNVLFVALLLIFGVFASKITSRFGVPVLLLFLGIGIFAGNGGIQLIDFDSPVAGGNLANLALMFILFDSGYGTSHKNMRDFFGPAMTLATFGVALTAGSLGALIFLVSGMPFWDSMLIGVIISSTDAAAMITILRENPMQARVATTLEVESAANDPMAILLTTAVIGTLVGETGSVEEFLQLLVWKLVIGVACGYVVSRIGAYFFNRLRSENTGFYYVLIISVILLAFGLAESLKASGILAVFFGGYFMNGYEFTYKSGLGRFISGISSFANMGMFLMLGLLVSPTRLPSVWVEGVVVALAMVFIARPLATWICVTPFKYSAKEKSFIAWGGIKGSVAIVLATYPAMTGKFPVEFSEKIFDIVFFAVILSCILQGTTLNKVGTYLGLKAPRRAKRLHSIEMLSLAETESRMFETEISPTAAIAGRELQQIDFPPNTRVVLIIRNEKTITPSGRVRILAEDTLFILTTPIEESLVNNLLNEKAAGAPTDSARIFLTPSPEKLAHDSSATE